MSNYYTNNKLYNLITGKRYGSFFKNKIVDYVAFKENRMNIIFPKYKIALLHYIYFEYIIMKYFK